MAAQLFLWSYATAVVGTLIAPLHACTYHNCTTSQHKTHNKWMLGTEVRGASILQPFSRVKLENKFLVIISLIAMLRIARPFFALGGSECSQLFHQDVIKKTIYIVLRSLQIQVVCEGGSLHNWRWSLSDHVLCTRYNHANTPHNLNRLQGWDCVSLFLNVLLLVG